MDRLSALPDSLLCVILNKLHWSSSLREVVKCSVLSKRWRVLHRELQSLFLDPYLLTPPHLRPPTPDDPLSVAAVENIISNVLQSQSADLLTVRLTNDMASSWDLHATSIQWRFTRQSVSNWLECIARKNVKVLILRDSPEKEIPAPAFFSCTCLTVLVLYNYILTRLPTQFAGFKDLLDCAFVSIDLTDESLAAYISHCPRLSRLQLVNCDGLRRPVISSLSLTDLVVFVYGMEVLTVNCPRLKKLRVFTKINDIRVNGVLFGELSPAIKTMELHIGNNLNALLLDSSYTNCSAAKFLEIMGSLKSLKVLEISLSGVRRAAVPVLNLLGRLPNLERFALKGHLILEELQGNSMPSYLTFIVANLQSLEIHINNCDETEIGFLSCLLQRSPLLKNFNFAFPNDPEGEQRNLFLNNWTNVKKAHEEGKIPEKICEFLFYF